MGKLIDAITINQFCKIFECIKTKKILQIISRKQMCILETICFSKQ